MKVVITGARGFIGKYLMERFAKESDIEAIGLSRKDNCDYSSEKLNEILTGADAVVHLAGIRDACDSLSAYDPDMQMCENILDAMLKHGTKKIIYASSRTVYGQSKDLPWTEETDPKPVLAYAENKLRCEKLCLDWADRTAGAALVLRIAQVFGIGEETNNMMNTFMDRAARGEELRVIGKSAAKRQYIYCKDLAEIIYRLTITDGYESGIMNIGMPQSYTNLEIAQAVNKAFHNDTSISYEDAQPETIKDSVMEVRKMLRFSGFMPRDMEHALEDIYSSFNR